MYVDMFECMLYVIVVLCIGMYGCLLKCKYVCLNVCFSSFVNRYVLLKCMY